MPVLSTKILLLIRLFFTHRLNSMKHRVFLSRNYEQTINSVLQKKFLSKLLLSFSHIFVYLLQIRHNFMIMFAYTHMFLPLPRNNNIKDKSQCGNQLVQSLSNVYYSGITRVVKYLIAYSIRQFTQYSAI